jgi:hypothetical protein
MPAPRTTRDIEARNRQVVLNRNRRFQRRISVPQAAQNAGTFRPGDLQRASRLATAPSPAPRGRRRAGPAGPARRAAGTSAPQQRGGLLSAARNLVNRARSNRARRRANRAASRANRLRNRG